MSLKEQILNKLQVPEFKCKTFKLVFELDKTYYKEYESLLNSLFGLQFTNEKVNPYFTFGIISEGEKTDFYVSIFEDYIEIFRHKISSINSHIQLEEIDDPLIYFTQEIVDDKTYQIMGYELKLMYDDNTKKLKGDDIDRRFITNLLNSMNNINSDACSMVEISVQSINNYKNSKDYSSCFANGVIGATNLTMKGLAYLLDSTLTNGLTDVYKEKSTVRENNEVIKDDNNLLKLKVNIRILSKSINRNIILDNINSMAAVFSDLSADNCLVPYKIKYPDLLKRSMKNYSILSTREISQFLHLPHKDIGSENMQISNCRKIFDRNIAKEGVVFGNSNGSPAAFSFSKIPLSTKIYKECYKSIERYIDNIVKPRLILGQPGSGKSEWIINYAIALIKLGLSLIIVDPKNDTQQRLIETIPVEFFHKVDYLNFGDTDYPPSMNIFRKRKDDDPTENSLIVSSFISLMKKEFSRNWGFKIQRTLQMTAEAILLLEPCTLNEFELMLTEREYRENAIERMKDIEKRKDTKSKAHIRKLIKFWERFNLMKDADIARETEPVMNQIGVFLSNRVIRSIVAQKESYDFRKSIDEGRITIINIPEGTLADNTRLLASMINKAIWLDIQSRANVDISERFPVIWIIDEAHEIVDDEFVGILTKSRAYRAGLTLVTQGLTNFKNRDMENIKELILTNCKNKIAFRLGFYDAKDFTEEFEPLTSNDLQNCPDYHFFSKILLDNGSISNPFFSSALPMVSAVRNYDEFLKHHRSGRFTVDEIENELDERIDAIRLYNTLVK